MNIPVHNIIVKILCCKNLIPFPYILFLLFSISTEAQTIAINEVMASNSSTIADEDGDFEDWIELHNYGDNPVNLHGFGLSDDYSNPMKWVFPEVTIDPGEYLLVWASGKDRKPSDYEQYYINGLRRDVYTGIPGTAVYDLINHPGYPDQPSSSNLITGLFEAPANIGDYYGQRIHGLIKAPVTGNYIFWIASDDNGALYLSSTSNPEDTVLIASVPGWTNPRQWNKYTQQQSAPITLQEGNYYYVMAFMKEHEGGDNLAVGWRLPDSSFDRPINGQHLFRASSELHTNFSISSTGEEIILSDPDGIIISELQPVSIPTDISHGRVPDGTGEWYYFNDPTPGYANTSEASSEILTPPLFSVFGGFYSEEFELTLNHPDEEVQIIYTLDGSEPDPDNTMGTSYPYKNYYPQVPGNPFGDILYNSYQSHVYSNPIPIYDRSGEPDKLTQITTTWDNQPWYKPSTPVKKATIIRVKAVKPGAISSNVTTNSYFITPEGTNPYNLPVISLSVQEDELFDYFNGIYVAGQVFDNWRESNPNSHPNGGTPSNYHLRGIEQEKPAHFEFFEKNSSGAMVQQDVGIRIHGGWSRSWPLKSIRVYARNIYGNSTLEYPFFDDLPYSSYKRLILRNSGNDYWSAYFRDAIIQRMVSHLDAGTQAFQPSLLFLNGEYWGIHHIRERYDKHYLARTYGIDGENIDLLDNYGIPAEGNSDHYDALRSFIQNSAINHNTNYEYVQTQMDVSNFVDFQIAHIYSANTDWPGNNVKYWRLRTPAYIPGAPKGYDGRWRWLVLDTDFGFGLHSSYSHNTLAFATETNGPSWPNPPWSTLFLRKLLENDSFRIQFINRFADLLNTAFLPERVSGLIQETRDDLLPEMPQQIHRWVQPAGNVTNWNNNVNVMLNFANQRPVYQRNHIRQQFEITKNITLTVDVNHASRGRIKVNTIEIDPSTPGVDESPYPWTGIYFHGVPVEIKALANQGYAFSHWEGDNESNSGVINITPTKNISLTAHFIPVDQHEQELIHYWHFNTMNDSLSIVESNFSITGNGFITYPGIGAGYMDGRTHRPEDPVSNLNLQLDQQPDQGAVLRARNPSDTRELLLEIPTTGYKHINIAYATTRTINGAVKHTILYSTDGGNEWIQPEEEYTIPLLPEWELKQVDLTGDEAVNNNSELLFKILFWGENTSGSSGNNRFDNFSVSGIPISTHSENTNFENPGVTISPNPVGNHFTLTVNKGNFYNNSLHIYSIDGKLLKSMPVTSTVNTIQVDDLAPGVYILTFSDGKTRINTRLIKQ